jgi:hypothetical protein
MIGSVVGPTGSGLDAVAAFVELARDLDRYAKALAELSGREARLEARAKELDGREVGFGERLAALDAREAVLAEQERALAERDAALAEMLAPMVEQLPGLPIAAPDPFAVSLGSSSPPTLDEAPMPRGDVVPLPLASQFQLMHERCRSHK